LEVEKTFEGLSFWREPGRPRSLRRAMVLPWINRLGSKRDTASLVGGSRWSTGVRLRGLIKKCRSGEIGLETTLSITGEEESSEERSPRAYRAERGSEGSRDYEFIERVAKPCGWAFEMGRQPFRRFFKRGSAKKGSWIWRC
jgi:hypothetical protein